jgi:hypoxanthine phosphoribosyltransferase
MILSSYRDKTRSSGRVEVLRDIEADVRGRDVLLIDDILESGRTLRFAKELMYERGAKSVSLAVLLDKREKRKTDLEADYVGFECPDHFVVGYGMDVAYAFRELPFVGVVTGDAE